MMRRTFVIRIADRPADATHHYGRAKVENLSALLEALLLLLTALWVAPASYILCCVFLG